MAGKEFESLRATGSEKRLDDFLAGKFLRLQSHQQFVRNFFNPASPSRTLHLMHATGCHAAGTRVLLSTGRVELIENIRPGQLLMGSGGSPIPVLGTVTGRETMWRLTPSHGEEWWVNGNHILYLYNTITQLYVTMTVNQYHFLPSEVQRHLWMVRTGINHLRHLVGAIPPSPGLQVPIGGGARHLKWPTAALAGTCSEITPISELSRPPTEMELYRMRLWGFCIYGGTVYMPNRWTPDQRPLVSFCATRSQRGKYYGVTLPHDHLFLGFDMTVHHNTGKTLAAVGIAHEFALSFQTIFNAESMHLATEMRNAASTDRATPSIFVLGYRGTKMAFIRELMRYPQLGFISSLELDALERMRQSNNVEGYKELFRQVRRRIGVKSRGGMYKFYGYDEFVNRLFPDEEEGGRVNTALLESMRDGLLICDEIHHTYNMTSKNKRGMAIEYVLRHCPTLRFLSLSATLVNNRPTEILECLAYLHPGKSFPVCDYFSGRRQLLLGARERLAEAFQDRVSFLQLTDAARSPTLLIPPDSRLIPHLPPYLHFNLVQPSDLHQRALDSLANAEVVGTDLVEPDQSTEAEDADETSGSIPLDGQSILDMVFPAPGPGGVVPLFRSGAVRAALVAAPPDWRAAHGIGPPRNRTYYTLTGPCLRIDNPAPQLCLADLSTKYNQFIHYLFQILSGSGGVKVLVYHPRIQGSGLLQLAEIMRENGFIEMGSEALPGTRCGLCGKYLREHSAEVACRFRAAKFMTIHSDINPAAIVTAMNQFNGAENTRGAVCDIMIGSRLIEESYDFKAVRHLVILSVPIHIGAMIQLRGRAVRTDSHASLPLAERNVTMAIFATGPEHGIEMERYEQKLLDYQFIQHLMSTVAESAIDSNYLYPLNIPAPIRAQFQVGRVLLEATDYTPTARAHLTDRFRARLYGVAESDLILFIIKRLFSDMARPPIWVYADLFAAVKAPPFPVSVNPEMLSEGNFALALGRLVKRQLYIMGNSARSEIDIISKYIDPNESHVWRGGVEGQIINTGRFYIFAPFETGGTERIGTNSNDKYDENIRNRKLVAIYRTAATEKWEPRLEVGRAMGGMAAPAQQRIFDIGSFLTRISVENAFDSARKMLDRLGAFDLDLLQTYSSDVQISLVKFCIARPDGAVWAESVVAFYQKMNVIINAAEVRQFPAIAAQLTSPIPALGPVGIVLARHITLMDGPDKWILVSKSSMNRHHIPPENPVIIGLLEDQPGGGMKFKIRQPRAAGPVGDARLVERGVICSIRGKTNLESILAEIRPLIRTADMAICGPKRRDDGVAIPLRSLCREVFGIIIALESRERLKSSRSHSLKYFYGWWDELLS